MFLFEIRNLGVNRLFFNSTGIRLDIIGQSPFILFIFRVELDAMYPTLLKIDLPFLNDHPFLDIVLRALAVYFFMIAAIRVFGKKELAQLSVIDLVFILLISNAVQNAMVGPDTSLAGGLIAAGSLFAANFTLKNILYRHEKLNHLLQGESVVLVYKGQVEVQHCKKAEITIEELEAAAREHGVSDLQHVDLAMLEIDGNISIISHDFQKKSKIEHPKKKRLRGRILKT